MCRSIEDVYWISVGFENDIYLWKSARIRFLRVKNGCKTEQDCALERRYAPVVYPAGILLENLFYTRVRTRLVKAKWTSPIGCHQYWRHNDTLHCAYLTESIFRAVPGCCVHLRFLHFPPSLAQKTHRLERAKKKNNTLEGGQSFIWLL